MTVERDVSEILANLEGRRPGSWGQQAAIVADGVRGSGIIDRIDASSDRVQTNLAGLAAVMGVSAQAIASEISTSNRFLGMVIDSLRDPLATAANERFRTGLTALQKGWRPEAIEELQESVKLYRFHPETHAALGHALAAEGRLAEAAASYTLAQRYSAPDDPSFAAGCALLAAAALENSGQPQQAAELILSSMKSLPEFAELPLAHARIAHDTSSVRSALKIAPDLVVAAMAAEIPGVEEAADELAAADDGPVSLATRFITALERLRVEFPDATTNQVMPRFLGNSAVEDLMAAAVVFKTSKRVVAEVRQDYERSYKRPERRDTPNPVRPSSPLAPLASEMHELEAELRQVAVQLTSLGAEQAKMGALLSSTPQVFLYATALKDYLPDQNPEVSRMLDELAEVEQVIRVADVDDRNVHFDWVSSKFFELKKKLAALEVEDPADRRDRDGKEYFQRIQMRHQELAQLLEDANARKTNLEAQTAVLQGDIALLQGEIALQQEESRRSFETEQEADRLAFESALAAWGVRDARWRQLIGVATSIAGQVPPRRSPWDGSAAVR